MDIFVLLLIFACVVVVALTVLFFNEQVARRALNKKISVLESANKSLTNEISVLNSPSGARKIAGFIDKIKLKDIMSSNVVSISEDTAFIEVPRKMREFDIRHLPVVSGDAHLVGIITERMLYKIRSPRLLENGEWYYDEDMLNDIILRNVMERNVISLHEDVSMGQALLHMANSKVGCIPIVGLSNNLIGVVTRKDVLRSLASLYAAR